jgi:hypothetical protein
MLYVPAALALSRDEQNGLIEFVNSGGTLVIEAATGLFDQTGTIQTGLMEEIAGLKGRVVESHDWIPVQWTASNHSRGKFVGRYYKQFFRSLASDVEVLAYFQTGEPAVCWRAVGQGRLVWVGTLCAAANIDDATGSRPITRWALRNGYREIESLTAPPGTVVRLHRTPNGELGVIAINYRSEPSEIHVVLSTAPDIKAADFVVSGRDGAISWFGSG